MKGALLVLLAGLLAGCSSAPPASPAPPQSTLERVAIRTVGEPVPSCEPGHEGALVDGVLTIGPGEAICVQIEVRGDEVVALGVVATATAGNTLVVRSWREPGSSETFMSLHNPLETNLSYEANMLRAGTSQWEYTSSCAVLSRRIGIEHWPYSISQFKLNAFKSLPPSQQIECR